MSLCTLLLISNHYRYPQHNFASPSTHLHLQTLQQSTIGHQYSIGPSRLVFQLHCVAVSNGTALVTSGSRRQICSSHVQHTRMCWQAATLSFGRRAYLGDSRSTGCRWQAYIATTVIVNPHISIRHLAYTTNALQVCRWRMFMV